MIYEDIPARLLAEDLINFMLNECPDGIGLIAFDAAVGHKGFHFTKLAGLIGARNNIERLFRATTKAIIEPQMHAVNIMITDLGEDDDDTPGVHTLRSYALTDKGEIRPFLSNEIIALSFAIPDVPGVEFKYERAWDWAYDPDREPASILSSPIS